MMRQMDNKIHYLNTDLDVTSDIDLTDLAAALEASGVFALHVTPDGNGTWYAIFETDESHEEPDSNIASLLAAIESLSPALRDVWHGCSQKEFNIGYDCGAEPWAFNQGLSSAVLGRMAAVGATLRITLYPDRPPK